MRYIDADAICTYFKALAEQAEMEGLYNIAHIYKRCLQLVNDAPTADVVPRAELAVRSFKDAATIEALQKQLAVAKGVLKYILSDFKKEIHDKAVYPNCHGVEPYISLKVFDAVINKLIGS